MEILVRAVTPADADGLRALLEASYGTLLRDRYDADLFADVLPRITEPSPWLLAGVLLCLLFDHSSRGLQGDGLIRAPASTDCTNNQIQARKVLDPSRYGQQPSYWLSMTSLPDHLSKLFVSMSRSTCIDATLLQPPYSIKERGGTG